MKRFFIQNYGKISIGTIFTVGGITIYITPPDSKPREVHHHHYYNQPPQQPQSMHSPLLANPNYSPSNYPVLQESNKQEIKDMLTKMREIKRICRKYGWLNTGPGGYSPQKMQSRHRDSHAIVVQLQTMIETLPTKERGEISTSLEYIKSICQKYGWMKGVGPGGWSEDKMKRLNKTAYNKCEEIEILLQNLL